MDWWVARTEARAELKVRDALAGAYCPVVRVRRRRGRKMVDEDVALFPRYVFAPAGSLMSADPQVAHAAGAVRWLRGPTGAPQGVRDEVVAGVRVLEEEIASQRPPEAFSVGQQVKLGEVDATIKEILRGRVRVAFKLLGAERTAVVRQDALIAETAVAP